jgi:hypothetical protein
VLVDVDCAESRRRERINEVGPELADANFCDSGAEQARVINTIIDMLNA